MEPYPRLRRDLVLNHSSSISISLALVISLACFVYSQAVDEILLKQQQQQQQQQKLQAKNAFAQYLEQLREQDTCGAVYTSKAHGYDVKEYKIVTKDNYELKLHRLVHPEDYSRGAASSSSSSSPPQPQPPKKRKPYLLVHGLIGTSASFVLNVDELYRAPPVTFKSRQLIEELLRSQAGDYAHEWQSTAQMHQRASFHEQAPRFTQHKKYARLHELDYDGDQLNFAREFRQAYRKFHLPRDSLGYTTNSLAFTLSNFGYDVWMVNLRGNEYSRGYNGPMSAARAEYWDFNIETIIKEDLTATIQFIMRQVECTDPIGLVTYSYSGAHVMGLLKRFPKYLEQLQPIVMLAPTLLTATKERGKTKYFLQAANMLVSKNGPFPTLGREITSQGGVATKTKKRLGRSSLLSLAHLDTKLELLACQLPVASKLCRLLEMVIHGNSQQVATVRGLLAAANRSGSLMKRDNECGQTSKAVLHEIFANLKQENINPNYMPFLSARIQQMSRPAQQSPRVPLRRSIILIHSQADQVSTMSEVERLRTSALKTLTLTDYVIEEPDFDHADFLFSTKNQFLVNAEVVRQVLLYDLLLYRSQANRIGAVPRGF